MTPTQAIKMLRYVLETAIPFIGYQAHVPEIKEMAYQVLADTVRTDDGMTLPELPEGYFYEEIVIKLPDHPKHGSMHQRIRCLSVGIKGNIERVCEPR
jgi:hypothetical protein